MDRTTRRAALWATVIAAPLTLLIVFLAASQLTSAGQGAGPDPAAGRPTTTISPARPQPTTPVTMPAPALAQRPATVCRALLSHLPQAVGELLQRPVSSGSEQNAAYGEPALTVACGVAEVPVARTEDVWTVNRVCWQVTERADTVELTTVDREVPVRVTVPRDYRPPLQWVTPLADAVLVSVPSTEDAPTGCQP